MRYKTKPRVLYDVYRNGEYLFTGFKDAVKAHLKMTDGMFDHARNADVYGRSPEFLIIPDESSRYVMYSYYKGNTLRAVGTKYDIADHLGIKPNTVIEMASRTDTNPDMSRDITYVIPLSAQETEEINIQEAIDGGCRIFTICDKTLTKSYEYYQRGEYKMSGTMDEIVEYTGLSKGFLYNVASNPQISPNHKVVPIGYADFREYAAYDGNKNLLMVGSKDEILEKLDISHDNFEVMLANRNIQNKRKYIVPMC